MKAIIAAIPVVVLAACQSPGAGQSPTEDPCGAGSRQHLVGTPASSLDKSTLPEFSRILHPNTPMTRDYRLDRLNVYVDEGGKISKVTCG
jgi:hypothetical protein